MGVKENHYLLIGACILIASVHLSSCAPHQAQDGEGWGEPSSSELKEDTPVDEYVEDPDGTSGTHQDLSASEIKPYKFLNQFGYITDEELENTTGNSMAENKFQDAVLQFQKLMGLNESGRIDNETAEAMISNRCGNKDINRAEFIDGNRGVYEDPLGGAQTDASGKRAKRYALMGSRWPKKTISYRVSKYSSNRISKREVDNEIDQAFKTWAAVSPLKFVKKNSGPVDIELKFQKDEHDGCDLKLTKTTNVLAHAYEPGKGIAGDVHFNDYFKWSAKSGKGNTRLLPVAIHELGHSLGISHSHLKKAIMFPKDGGLTALHNDDKKAIRFLYGKQKGRRAKNRDEVDDPQKPKCDGTARFIKGPNCRVFYFCEEDGEAKRKFCPSSLVWNQQREWCDYPHNVPSCFDGDSEKEESQESEEDSSK